MFCAESPNINPMADGRNVRNRRSLDDRVPTVMDVSVGRTTDRDIVAALEVERRRLQDDAKRPDLAKDVAERHYRRAWISPSTASFADYFYPAVTTPMTVAANRSDLDSPRHCFRQHAAQICWQSVVTRITTNRQPCA